MAVFLKRMPALAKYFKSEGHKVLLSKKHTFIRPDDTSPWVYYLDNGLVEISYEFSDDTTRLLGYFFPGVVFAQVGTFFDKSGIGAEYATAKESVVYRLPRARFFQLITDDSACNKEYMDFLLRNQFLLIERVAYMGERNIERITTRLIISLAKYYGHQIDGDVYQVDIPITQEVIARFAHSTRESVSKTMRKLQREKIITLKNKTLTVNNMSQLQAKLET